MHHPQWGNLNLGLLINLAPGRLGQYTKIVYFCPRYVFWNRHHLGISVGTMIGHRIIGEQQDLFIREDKGHGPSCSLGLAERLAQHS